MQTRCGGKAFQIRLPLGGKRFSPPPSAETGKDVAEPRTRGPWRRLHKHNPGSLRFRHNRVRTLMENATTATTSGGDCIVELV